MPRRVQLVLNQESGEEGEEEVEELETGRPPCGGNFTAIGFKCYYIEQDNAQEWLSAIYQCSRLGGHLARIQGRHELDNISKKLKPNSEYFVNIKTPMHDRFGIQGEQEHHLESNQTQTKRWNSAYVVYVMNSFGHIATRMGYSNKLFVCEKRKELTERQKRRIINKPPVLRKIGERYYFIEHYMPSLWNAAVEYCEKRGGHLATPRNELELSNLSEYLQPGLQYYIDLNDYLEEGKFMSVTTGLQGNYTAWAAGEPNMKFGIGNVVIEKTESGTYMRHVPHADSYLYICEGPF
ncbi:uncharacterized protein Dana_GF28109 [Drosophila ananassae]|uniref:C-type lectin domain-containing protein n=1 Tax=Drosophila ananassae TaxID=7217 RepID=A0A0P8Y412_DROAN|nr:uncharacterized protein Dana_GF28109 [Drosophila ananassae]